MVLGESQILGQLKDAYGVAMRADTTGTVLSKSMEKAFQIAKRVRTETAIAKGAANVSSVAVELAVHVFGDLSGKQVLVIGAVKMSALAARHLRTNGCSQISVINRSYQRAEALAAEIDGVARGWETLEHELEAADVVISSTGATSPVLTKAFLRGIVKKRRYRPLVLIDIAVPRDVEPAVAKLDGVFLFDIDDLERVVASNLKERQREADAALAIVEGEVGEFEKWLRSQRAVPTIRSLREHFQRVADGEVEKAIRALVGKDLGTQEVEQSLKRLSQLIVSKLLHTPMTTLRDQDQDLDELIAAAQKLFALPESSDVKEGDVAPTPPGVPQKEQKA
jgi:glutamyl-tRNA reductase